MKKLFPTAIEMSTAADDHYQNPEAFRLLTCYYCRTRKPDAIKDSDGKEVYRFMYSEIIPVYPPLTVMKSRQIWICDACMESII
jgi:hypothetical protein